MRARRQECHTGSSQSPIQSNRKLKTSNDEDFLSLHRHQPLRASQKSGYCPASLAVMEGSMRLEHTIFAALLLVSQAATAADQPLLKWRSADWASPTFAFPYESGEIQREREGLYRLDERFEKEVRPMGPVSPQAANFWRICVVSHFAAKQGFAGWAFAEKPAAKWEPTASTMYFVVANAEAELPEELRPNFSPTSSFQPICGKFLKPEHHWWK